MGLFSRFSSAQTTEGWLKASAESGCGATAAAAAAAAALRAKQSLIIYLVGLIYSPSLLRAVIISPPLEAAGLRTHQRVEKSGRSCDFMCVTIPGNTL